MTFRTPDRALTWAWLDGSRTFGTKVQQNKEEEGEEEEEEVAQRCHDDLKVDSVVQFLKYLRTKFGGKCCSRNTGPRDNSVPSAAAGQVLAQRCGEVAGLIANAAGMLRD